MHCLAPIFDGPTVGTKTPSFAVLKRYADDVYKVLSYNAVALVLLECIPVVFTHCKEKKSLNFPILSIYLLFTSFKSFKPNDKTLETSKLKAFAKEKIVFD